MRLGFVDLDSLIGVPENVLCMHTRLRTALSMFLWSFSGLALSPSPDYVNHSTLIRSLPRSLPSVVVVDGASNIRDFIREFDGRAEYGDVSVKDICISNNHNRSLYYQHFRLVTDTNFAKLSEKY